MQWENADQRREKFPKFVRSYAAVIWLWAYKIDNVQQVIGGFFAKLVMNYNSQQQ